MSETSAPQPGLQVVSRDESRAGTLPAAEATVYVVKALPGIDCLAEVNAGLARLKASGGGTLRLPAIGGVGYYISDRIFVDFSNCVIELGDNLKLTKNRVRQTYGVVNPNNGSPNTPNLYDGVVVFRGTIGSHLTGCALNAPARVTIDGNGAAIAAEGSYVHDAFANGNYAAVQFTFCTSPIVQNIVTTNSLSFGIQLAYAPGGLVRNCKGTNTVNENGIQVAFNRSPVDADFSATDQRTWGGYRVVDCEAESCANHGIGSYGAVGVQIINPKISNCGNDNGVQQAGPAGGINVEYDGVNPSRNYRVMIVNPQVVNSIGFGIRTNCKGTQVVNGNVVGTRKPTAYAESAPYLWGSAVFVQGAGTLETFGLFIDGSDRVGYRMHAAGSLYPSLKVNGGQVSGCVQRAFYGLGVSQVTVSPQTIVINNGDASDATNPPVFTSEFNNGSANADQGTVQFGGWHYGNRGGVVTTSRVGTVILDNLAGGENTENGTASAGYHSCYIDTCLNFFKTGQIDLSGANLKQTRVVKVIGQISKISGSADNVQGFQTASQLPKLDLSGATINVTNQGSVLYGFDTNAGAGIAAFSIPAATASSPGILPGIATKTLTVKGAAIGNLVTAAYNKALAAGVSMSAEVTAANTVTVTWSNSTGSVVNVAGGGELVARVTRVLGN